MFAAKDVRGPIRTRRPCLRAQSLGRPVFD